MARWSEQAASFLLAGNAVAVATESFFALAVDATSSAAVDRLFAIKSRDLAKGVGLMVPRDAWRQWVSNVPTEAEKLAAQFWPGPLSLVLPAASTLDSRLVVDGHISLRIAGPSPAAELVEAVGRPLTATSANITGLPPCRTDAEVRAQLQETNALFIVPGECPGGLVSTLVRFEGARWTILREGAISRAQIESCLASA
jgi:L-threonylcarbamoyladenylate synthase